MSRTGWKHTERLPRSRMRSMRKRSPTEHPGQSEGELAEIRQVGRRVDDGLRAACPRLRLHGRREVSEDDDDRLRIAPADVLKPIEAGPDVVPLSRDADDGQIVMSDAVVRTLLRLSHVYCPAEVLEVARRPAPIGSLLEGDEDA